MEHSIASVLKLLRKSSKLSAENTVVELDKYGIKISVKTLYGYESGLSMPNANVFVALCKIYKCDNPMIYFGVNANINHEEIAHIKKYRALDEHGKEMVDFTLSKESERSKIELEKKATKPISIAEARASKDLEADAANQNPDATPEQTAFDDDVMDDPDF